jgi:hypothetical protein
MSGIVERIVAIIAEEANTDLLDKLDLTDKRLENIEAIMSILADKIKALVAVETEEGAVLVAKVAELTAALSSATATIAVLEPMAASVPAMQAELDSLKADLASADEAAATIAGINPTPVADGVIDEVVENPEIVTPPVVEEAPTPTTETIPETPVVDAAIDALDGAGEESAEVATPPVSPG